MKKSTTRKRTGRVHAIIAAAPLAAAVIMVPASPASADYYSGGMPGKSFNVRVFGVNPTWQGHFNTARANWNNAPGGIGVSIGQTTTANASMTAASYSASWYGIYTPYNTRATRSFTIQINSRTLANDSPNLTAWIESTSTHELGHALSLADNPNTTAISLMKHDRDRANNRRPQSYDRREVVRIYG